MKRLTWLILPLATIVVAHPAPAQAPDPAERDRRDSIALASTVAALLVDSVQAEQRARAIADSLLTAPMPLWPEAPAIGDAERRLLRAKTWLLYLNPGIKLTIVARAGTDQPDRERLRAAGDTLRAYLRANGARGSQVSVAARMDTVTGPSRFDFIADRPVERATFPGDGAPPEPVRATLFLRPDRDARYRWGTVRIFYATDRERTGEGDPANFYAGTRQPVGTLEFGRVEVTVPRVHRPGVIERPVWYRLERSEDADRHITVKRVQPMAQPALHDSLRGVLAVSGSRETLVFIHGYNVSFADAAMRTAQLVYDLGFDGAPILYSWPSRGSIFRYAADRENAEFSAPHLAAFLDSVVAVTGTGKVHVIAHSMGNRVLSFALQELTRTRRDTGLANVVLAAADVDAGNFQQNLAAHVRSMSRRVTVYMSGEDRALRASRILSSNLRLGEATSPMLVVPGMETIDASSIPADMLGHGYIVQAAPVLGDLRDLLGGRSPPRARLREARTPEGSAFWVLLSAP